MPIVRRSAITEIPVNEPFKLEAVIVSDKFSDFLTRTLPTNKYLFDQLVVVTSPEDLQTQRICEFYHCQCVKTDALRSRWKEFHKGEGVNAGLDLLTMNSWVVHMDADIWLPPQTRDLLEKAELDQAMIYGIDRFNVKGYAAWDEFLSMPVLQHEDETYIHTNAFRLGTRFMFNHANGWMPLGYFQMWHPRASGVRDYPSNHASAGRTDTQHSQRWPRSMRSLIPEVIGYHLESEEAAPMGANWNGRTTSTFSHNPTKPVSS